MKFNLIVCVGVLAVTSIAGADAAVPVFQVQWEAYVTGPSNGSDEDHVPVPILEKDFTVNNTSCSIRTHMIGWNYGPTLACAPSGAENSFSVSARCDLRQPGDTSTAVLGISDSSGKVSNIGIMCKTTYDRAKPAPPAAKKPQAA